MAEQAARVRVLVVYAEIGHPWSRHVDVPVTSTVADAVDASGFRREYPDVSVAEGDLAIYGRRVKPGQPVRDGDRVEICRPLRLDPMEARRRRAQDRAPKS